MNIDDSNKWQADVLGHILLALASSPELRDALVYKGALILNKRLGTDRMSLDIDSNLTQKFTLDIPQKKQQEEFLDTTLRSSISKYFNRQDPVRFELTSIKIKNSPQKIDHPLGWDAFLIKIKITDYKNLQVRNLPVLTIDVAAPEELSENSVSDMNIGGFTVRAYTLERIAGEKLRAFLSTLPTYRTKVEKPGTAVRVKDIYDLTQIHRVKPIEDEIFWGVAGEEFKMACSSRYIDCEGLVTFKENWGNTKKLYETDSTLRKDVGFDEVDEVITNINAFFLRKQIIPFFYPIPK
jgi:hypothetical protein